MTEERQKLGELELGTAEYEKQREVVSKLEAQLAKLAGEQAKVWEGQQGFATWMQTKFSSVWANFSAEAQAKLAEIQSSGLSAENQLKAWGAWIGGAFEATWERFRASVANKFQEVRSSGKLNLDQLDAMRRLIQEQLLPAYRDEFGEAVDWHLGRY